MTKQLTGTIVSLHMQKAAIVAVERKTRHPLYKKIMRRTKRYKARIPDTMQLSIGDTVVMQETRPLSKDMHFKIIAVSKQQEARNKKSPAKKQ